MNLVFLFLTLNKYLPVISSNVHLESIKISKIELFAKIVNGISRYLYLQKAPP